MPKSFTTQLMDTLHNGSYRRTRECFTRRCTLYVCTDCMCVANTIVSSKDADVSLKTQLKYTKSIRISISETDDTIVRVCDTCSLKRGCNLAYPLLEIPLIQLDGSPQCFGAMVFDQCLVMCPACSLLIERMDLRFSNKGEEVGWSCCFCNPF